MVNANQQSVAGRKRNRLLGQKLEQRLASYAGAAAGAGLLAFASPAQADIVYTPANVELTGNTPVSLDLNHAGHADFVISNHYYGNTVSLRWYLKMKGAAPGAGVVVPAPGAASQLRFGEAIGSEANFQGIQNQEAFLEGLQYVFFSRTTIFGYWSHAQNGYLGLRFDIGGQAHYGWARLSVQVRNYKIVATLTGYAYDTVANETILAGQTSPGAGAATTMLEPATLGVLALGSPALDLWRRTREAATGEE